MSNTVRRSFAWGSHGIGLNVFFETDLYSKGRQLKILFRWVCSLSKKKRFVVFLIIIILLCFCLRLYGA